MIKKKYIYIYIYTFSQKDKLIIVTAFKGIQVIKYYRVKPLAFYYRMQT